MARFLMLPPPAVRRMFVGILLTLPVIAAAVWFSTRSRDDIGLSDASGAVSERSRRTTVGGVARPRSDISGGRMPARSPDRYGLDSSTKLAFDPVTPQPPDANPAVASVYEAVTEKRHPERLSPAFIPAAFNRQAYLANPNAYLKIHEPGRVFQPAQPGPGVPVLALASKRNHVLQRGESVRLSVKTAPNMPVTYASFDLGAFDNGLASITVAADETGLAHANFNAAPGKKGEINILAASPVATEKVKFNVFVTSGSTDVSQEGANP